MEIVFALLIGVFSFLSYGGKIFPSGSQSAGTITPAPTTQKDCAYNLENNLQLKLKISSSLFSYLEGKTWVLLKRDAGVPAWKVNREMKEVGTTLCLDGTTNCLDNPDALGVRTFVGLGHCLGTPGRTCADPLASQVVFVLRVPGGPGNSTSTDPSSPGYWWYFNLYLDTSLLPANPSNNDVPEWVKNCKATGEREQTAGRTSSSFSLTESSDLGVTLPQVIKKTEIQKIGNPVHWNDLKENYLKNDETTKPETDWAELQGTYGAGEVWFSLGDRQLVLDFKDGKYYTYSEYEPKKAEGKTLKLGTFNPVRNFIYEWWTPSCKPALYFYPERPTELSVKVRPKGRLTLTLPESQTGNWQILAYPEGTIKFGSKIYPYLYYEAEIEKVKVPRQGFLVESEDLPRFFSRILPVLGLNSKESADFLEYWLPKLSDGKNWRISLVDEEELTRIEPIEFSVSPDVFLRVRFYFENLDNLKKTDTQNLYTYTEDLDFESTLKESGLWPKTFPKRVGFTVVDWGGILQNGSCGNTITIR